MAYNGSGVWSRLYSWTSDKNNQIPITASRMDAEFNDMMNNGFDNTLTRDGQGVATANLPMAGFRHTGVGNAVNSSDYAAYGQVQNSAPMWGGTATGTANAPVIAPSPAVTAYAAGQTFRWIVANPNTGPVTLAVSALAAKNVYDLKGNPLVQGAFPVAGSIAEATYDGAQFQLKSVQAFPSISLAASSSGGTLTIAPATNSTTFTMTFPSSRGVAGAVPFTDGTSLAQLSFGSPAILAYLKGANLNSTQDQSFTPALSGALPAKYVITGCYVTNSTGNSSVAAGGIYSAANKGGQAIADASNTYNSLTSSTKLQGLAFGTSATTTVYTASSLFLSLTTAQGATATADFYISGFLLP